jgi:uncharacterized membrane protein
VPTLIIGDAVLVGSLEIPQQLPLLAERLLAEGGSAWPDIPGLAVAVATPAPAATPAAGVVATPGTDPKPTAPAIATPPVTTDPPLSLTAMLERVGRDPLGNTVSIVVLVGLLLALAWAAVAAATAGRPRATRPPSRWIAVLALSGLAVAGYLSSVELAGGVAVCGPVGNCNAVHASVYARLFGIPVGLLGFLAYASVLGCWLVARRAGGSLAHAAGTGIVVLAAAGTLFSAYLTFLEPFVIGATCAWCLASALLMAAILVASVATVFAAPLNRAAQAEGSSGRP